MDFLGGVRVSVEVGGGVMVGGLSISKVIKIRARGGVNDLAIELSSVREESATDKANLSTNLSTILEEVSNLTEQQRVGESKRQNLAGRLELLNKAIRGKKPEVEPKNEKSMDAGKAEVEKSRDARNLGSVRPGAEDKGKLPADEPIASSWPSRNHGDQRLIYRDRQNRLRYEQYGDRAKT